MIRFSFVLASLLALGVTSIGVAGDGGYTAIVYGRPASGNALSIGVDTTWVAGEGYRPVRVTIRPIGKAAFVRDRQVTLECHRFEQPRDFPHEVTRRTIELPEGVAEVRETIYVPQDRIQSKTEMFVWEGRRGRQNVVRTTLTNRSNIPVWNEAVPSLLVVDRDVPRLSERQSNRARFRGSPARGGPEGLDDRIPQVANLLRGVRPMMSPGLASSTLESWVDVSDDVVNCEFVAPADLPVNWIGLTGVDILYVSREDLQGLKTEFPAQWAAVNAWLRGGGMLWLTGAGEVTGDIQTAEVRRNRRDVESLLDISAVGLEEGAVTNSTWVAPAGSGYGKRLPEFATNEGSQWINGRYITLAADETQPEKNKRVTPPFAFRGHQFGTVVTWSDDQFLAEEDRYVWEWTFRALSPTRWMWSQRNGLSMFRDNDEFFHFLIPGIGLAPVNSFRVIMTLFVLVIGPLNYTLLSRWKRLNWMLFTVPACAALATFALMNYALLTDGISVRARNRSLTIVDQQVGHAATWSRHAYYAGIAPAGGLTFPEDTAVYPILHQPLDRLSPYARYREWIWDDKQRLATGYITSRDTTQFLVQRSRPSRMRLDVATSSTGELSVTNRLRSRVLAILVRDAEGNYYTHGQMEDGGASQLKQAIEQDASRWLRTDILGRTPSLPPGVDLNFRESSDYSMWQYRNANRHLSTPTFAGNRMNQILLEWSGRGGLPRQSYLAVVDRCGEIPWGVDSPREVDVSHFVFGHFTGADVTAGAGR